MVWVGMLVIKTFCQLELLKKSHVFILFFFLLFFVFLIPLSTHTFKIFYFWPNSIFFIILSTQVSFFNHYLRLKHFLIFLKVARVSLDISPVTATQPNKKFPMHLSMENSNQSFVTFYKRQNYINEYTAINGSFSFCYKITLLVCIICISVLFFMLNLDLFSYLCP